MSKNVYPKELLCAGVEFIHALWIGHQALAMEALKSDTQFWNLMCNSLMSDEFSHDNPGINAYIIRTLALEVFYSGKNRLNENVKSIFQEIHSKNSLLKWSKHIHCSKFVSNEQGDGDHSLDTSSIDLQDSFALLTAWRDFLLIVAVHEPLSVSSDCKKQILKDILEHLQKEMKCNNSRALILLSELFLMLSRHWQRELISLLNSDEMKNPIFQILNEVAYNAETIHPREQLIVVSIAVFIVRLQSGTDFKIKNIKEWIVPCCQLLKKASILIHQPLDPKSIEGILKLPIVIVSLLNELIQVVKDWLPIIKNYSVIPLLLKSGFSIGNGIPHFLSMGSNKKAAEALCNTGFMSEVTLILSDIDMAAHISEKRKNLGYQQPKLSEGCVLAFFVRHKKMLDSKPLKSLETESLLKRTISEDDSQTPAEVEDIQQKLYELLAVTLTILTKYCPEMYETMSGHTIDYACVNMCLKLLVKNEKTPSPRKANDNPPPVNRHLLMYILEISLAILLSQSSIALTHPSLPARDKQVVRRELAAELNSMNITMNRYLRRGPLSPAGISTPSISPGISSKTHLTEFPFMKLISNLVDKLFK
ncbi:Nucleoporin NUP188 like protein [Argiope bruennichi]|uniref:Nucleoporin NUP188 like protein n=1 Tax=Argiope bruennichi TaxID=94029 RepID=A0A8T0FAH6_ARGBR|nr:Nucleoporin NUP188 like protein [Argiope bruennichi]